MTNTAVGSPDPAAVFVWAFRRARSGRYRQHETGWADMTDGIFTGASKDDTAQTLRLERANRHGLIVGAAGTGKMVTL